jgi:hypothetical protein
MVQSLGFRVQGSGFRVYGLWFMVQSHVLVMTELDLSHITNPDSENIGNRGLNLEIVNRQS